MRLPFPTLCVAALLALPAALAATHDAPDPLLDQRFAWAPDLAFMGLPEPAECQDPATDIASLRVATTSRDLIVTLAVADLASREVRCDADTLFLGAATVERAYLADVVPAYECDADGCEATSDVALRFLTRLTDGDVETCVSIERAVAGTYLHGTTCAPSVKIVGGAIEWRVPLKGEIPGAPGVSYDLRGKSYEADAKTESVAMLGTAWVQTLADDVRISPLAL